MKYCNHVKRHKITPELELLQEKLDDYGWGQSGYCAVYLPGWLKNNLVKDIIIEAGVTLR